MLLNFIGWIVFLLIGLLVGLVMYGLSLKRHTLASRVLTSILGAFIGGFLGSQFGIAGVTDFNPWSMLAALLGAVVAGILLHLLDRRELKVTPMQTDEAQRRNTMSMTADNSSLPRERLRMNVGILIGLILILPLLDTALLRLRLPSLSTLTPPFGAVGTVQSANGTLDYLVYSPAQYQSGTAIPVLVLLHGCMQDPVILEAASGMRAVADAQNFLLVYPQQNAVTSPHRCWNWYDQQNQHRDRGEPALLVEIVNQVQSDFSVDAERVYVAGISSGGAMTSILASCYPDVFAAAAVHSGMAYESANSILEALIAPMRGNQVPPNVAGRDAYECAGSGNQLIPLLVLHGSVDTVVMPINGQHTVEQFAQTNDFADDGTDNDSVQAVATNTQTGQVENGYTYTIDDFSYDGELLLMQRYQVAGLWHMWSGGTGIVPLSDPKAPNASDIIWGFLSAYRRQAP